MEYYSRIQLYVDGELATEEKEDLLSHLESCTGCSELLEDAQIYSSRIRAAQPSISAPDSLRTAVLNRVREAQTTSGPRLVKTQKTARFWPLSAVAAGLFAVAISLFILHGRRQHGPDPLIQAAVLAHQQLEQNAVPLDVASNSPQVVSAWFASRVVFPFRMANTGMAAEDRAKYQLTGGRLLTVGKDRVALLSFRLSDEVVSLLVGPSHLSAASGGTVVDSDGITFHSHSQSSLHITTWDNRGLTYVLTSSVPMGNSRKCSACHDARSSDKVTLRQIIPQT